ncbi:four helix bundle protein [Aquimarina gracilis]|uniref:Four helix bundle protein n=1 Tax=Aquimarina gracilis TaxID=874422 RepID=A0ABU6A0L0_9FLAO|nr:four helix bundle protein [Aquimarina gracilis]MEB3347595.1 four helix bundle protein [Aquimarina gracilis]
MNTSKSFEDLIVWQKTHQFVLKVYELTQNFPNSEVYGLSNQFRRASVSIAANIAEEGYKKKGTKDKLRFFNIAQGSLEECRYYLILTRDLSYQENINEEADLLVEVSELLNAYCKKILNSSTLNS